MKTTARKNYRFAVRFRPCAIFLHPLRRNTFTLSAPAAVPSRKSPKTGPVRRTLVDFPIIGGRAILRRPACYAGRFAAKTSHTGLIRQLYRGGFSALSAPRLLQRLLNGIGQLIGARRTLSSAGYAA